MGTREGQEEVSIQNPDMAEATAGKQVLSPVPFGSIPMHTFPGVSPTDCNGTSFHVGRRRTVPSTR